MKLTKLLALATLVITLGTSTLFAGSPRNVLFEEFTNASCPPCAAQNPTLEEYLMPKAGDNIIPLIFHPNFPGRDSMMSENSAMHVGRQNYYPVINQVGVPQILVDGKTPIASNSQLYYNGAPADTTAAITNVTADLGQNSPYTMSVEQTKDQTGKITITVKVKSDNDVTGNIYLKVAIAEGWHNYTNAGTNGEKNFYYIARQMFPDLNGVKLALTANEEKTFTYEYTPDAILNAPLLYSVAMIQDESNREVLQAATSGVPKPIETTVSIANKYAKFAAGTPQSIEVTVTNNEDKKIETTLSGSTMVMPAGWQASLSQNTLTLDAHQSGTATLTITPTANTGGFALVNIVSTPNPNYGIPVENSASTGRLSDQTQYLQAIGLDAMVNFPIAAITNYLGTENAAKLALVPLWDADFQNIINFNDYKLICMTLDVGSSQYLATSSAATDQLIQNLDNYVKSGKSLLLTEEALGYYANGNANVKVQNFMKNTLGIQYNAVVSLISNNQLLQAIINGTTDPLTSGIIDTTNTIYNSSFPFYCSALETYNTATGFGGTATPIFTSTIQNTTYNVGYKIQNGNARAVVLGFGLQAFSTPATATTVTKNIVDWLLQNSTSTGAVITADKSTYDFSNVEVDQSKNTSIKITNTGSKALNISTISIENDNDGVFSLVTTGSDFSIQPGANYTVVVKFAPTSQKAYSAKLAVNSDATNSAKFTVDLMGNGTIAGVSDDLSGDASKLTLSVAPNPVSSTSNVTFTLGGDIQKFVKLNMVDETGRVISTIFEGIAQPGVNNVNLNASALTSGKYFLIGEVDGYAVQLSVNVVK